MSIYKVGTLKASGIGTDCIMQDVSVAVESDSHEVMDELGNVCYVQQTNHRAVLNANLVAPRETVIPAPGMSLSVKGITLPTVTADGTVTGGISIADDGTSGAAVTFLITSATISTTNNDYPKYAITATRWMPNAIGAVKTNSASE